MATTNTDLTEEDAADLQFPKDPSPLTKSETDYCCGCCTTELVAPFFFCTVCEVNICTACFSNGAEFLFEYRQHENNHSYRIIRDDFSLFHGSDWTAKEERTLLDGLSRHGNNWELVARDLTNRTINEIKKHYDHFYLDRHGSPKLPKIPENATAVFPDPIVPYRCRIDDINDPPRYTPNSTGFNYLAGYNPARADFECEYDMNAEVLLSKLKPINVSDPHHEMLTNLQCAVFRSYNRRLQERQRWKQIIRDHGLILLRKVHSWLHRYDLTITRSVYEKLMRFMQFCTPVQFEMLMEGLHRRGELKIQIMRLCDFRQKGITKLADARLYLRLKPVHDKCENELKVLRSQLNVRDANKNMAIEIPTTKRRNGFTPIDIVGLPGYEKLSPSERELCRNVRFIPIAYFELKDLLISENKKNGSIKLKTARKMLKIDVNKTRRLYDFLVMEGFITKPTS